MNKKMCFLIIVLFSNHVFAADCDLMSQNLNFAVYSPTDITATKANSLVTIRCIGSGSVSGNVQLSTGKSGKYALRTMVGPKNNRLYYNVYYNLAASEIWGNGNDNTRVWTFQQNAPFTISQTMFGIIPAGQYIYPGIYNDSLTVSLMFN